MKGRPVEKAYMYEIVSNFRSGIDVDKMDYFRRDAYFLGIKREFDHHRYLKSLRVIQDNQGISTLSPPEKSKDDIRENLCELRKTLHRTAYQHKTVKKFEAHMVDILKLCDKTIRVSGRNGKKMSISEAALSGDTVAYSKLTDMFIESRLLENEDPELQETGVLGECLGRCLAYSALTASNLSACGLGSVFFLTCRKPVLRTTSTSCRET